PPSPAFSKPDVAPVSSPPFPKGADETCATLIAAPRPLSRSQSRTALGFSPPSLPLLAALFAPRFAADGGGGAAGAGGIGGRRRGRLPKFAGFQGVDLIAQNRRALEFQPAGGLLHFLLELRDHGGDVVDALGDSRFVTLAAAVVHVQARLCGTLHAARRDPV